MQQRLPGQIWAKSNVLCVLDHWATRIFQSTTFENPTEFVSDGAEYEGP